MKGRSIFCLLFILILSFSCKKEDLFEQPTLHVDSYILLELPGEFVKLQVDVRVFNNDYREVNLKDVEYQITIEGVSSETEQFDINQKILTDTPLELSLPITLKTDDAIQLLSMLDAGEELEYSVKGTFHVDDPILNLLNLPIDISGTADVEAGFEDFYKQPELEVNAITVSYNQNGTSTYNFEFDVDCMVYNQESVSVRAEEIEYLVTIVDIPSQKHLYSDVYSKKFSLDADDSSSLNLPVSMELNMEKGEALAAALSNGSIAYIVEGKVHVNELNGAEMDFILPLYLTGSLDADLVTQMFEQPDIEIVGYSLKELPGDSTYLDISMMLTNNDVREVYIKDVAYQAVIEGFVTGNEKVDIHQPILVGTPLELSLPISLLTEDAIQLLTKLNAGEDLDYTVTGTFHVDEPVLDLFDLPIDISGTASVEVGYDNFYEQPEVTVTDIDGTYQLNGFTSYTFHLNVNCQVKNVDARSVTIDEIEYTAIIEGIESEKHLYSETYIADLEIAGGETVDLRLPVTLTMGALDGANLLADLTDGTANYIIEGKFHAVLVDDAEADFYLPLYITGNVPASMIVR